MRVIVKVAEVCDCEAVQAGGPTRKSNCLPYDLRAIGLDQDGVGGDGSDSGSRSETEKFPSGGGKKRQIVSRPSGNGIVRANDLHFSG